MLLGQCILIIVGGASHAERLASALGQRRGNVADLTLLGWRLTDESAEDLASDIAGILQTNDQSKIILVLQVIDNTVFKGLIGDEICDPVKLKGRYHIPGKLVTIGQEELKELFGLATKAIRAARSDQVILISPLYRYITGRCCRDASHITNYDDDDFTKMLANYVQSISKQLRSLVWHRHWKNVSIVNPAAHMGVGTLNSLSSDEADVQIPEMLQCWGADPVHPTGEAYGQLAEMLLAKIAKTSGRDVSRVSLVAPPGAKKRKRSPLRDRRPSWVGGNVTEVGRRQAGPFGSSGQRGRGQDAGGPWAAYPHNRSSSSRGGNANWRGWRENRGHRGHRGGHSGHAAPWSGPR